LNIENLHIKFASIAFILAMLVGDSGMLNLGGKFVSIALILAMLVVEKGMNENGAPCS
jgi:hypothetical protein